MSMWPAPLSAERLGDQLRFGDVQWSGDGKTLVWVEGRSGEGALVAWTEGKPGRDLAPGLNVRGGLFYGGGEFGKQGQWLYFVEGGRQLWRVRLDGVDLQRLFDSGQKIASPRPSPNGEWLVWVQSDGQEDFLAARRVAVDGEAIRLASGADFYMQPEWSPNGDRLAWVEWDHPNMPWHGSRLVLARFNPSTGRLSTPDVVAGSPAVPTLQPAFSPDGRWLSFLVRRGEWDSLEVVDLENGGAHTVAQGGTLLQPAWEQGIRLYGWGADSRHLFYIRLDGAFSTLWRANLDRSLPEQIGTHPYTWLNRLSVGPAGQLAMLASTPHIPTEVISIQDDRLHTVKTGMKDGLVREGLAAVQAVEWSGLDGQPVHGLFFPAVASMKKEPGLPPAILHAHSGPTTVRFARFESERAYFNSRGWAWLDVNYRGSIGYGRSYEDALHGRWGELEVADLVSATSELSRRGLADDTRLALHGSSAGGFTVLNAFAHYPGRFRAGLCLYGISNLITLDSSNFKFEKHYNEWLIGKLPDAAEQYQERSPLFHAGKFRDPLALFQGSDDPVVLPDQSETIASALEKNQVPCLLRIYPGEGHSFRKAATLVDLYATMEEFLNQYVLSQKYR